MIHFKKWQILTLIAALIFIACSTFVKNAYRSEAVSKTAYETVLSGMGDLYKEGKIPASIKDDAIKLGHTYKDAHNASVVALAAYIETKSLIDRQLYLKATERAADALVQLIDFCEPYLKELSQ